MKSLFFYVTLFSLFGLVIGNQLKTTPCDLCIDIVNIIDAEMKLGNYSIQIITKIADEMCHLIGGEHVIHECDVITNSISEIMKWLSDKVPTETICHRLGFCP